MKQACLCFGERCQGDVHEIRELRGVETFDPSERLLGAELAERRASGGDRMCPRVFGLRWPFLRFSCGGNLVAPGRTQENLAEPKATEAQRAKVISIEHSPEASMW